MYYEWDSSKDLNNKQKHGIDFELASRVFDDPFVYEEIDTDHSDYNQYGEWEDRYYAIGLVEDVLYVVYTYRYIGDDEIIRIISARMAEKDEEELYFNWRNGLLKQRGI